MVRFLIFLALLYVPCANLRAEEADTRRLFSVVETDEETAFESLERISGGRYDLGFSAPSQSFESTDHYAPGPMARQKAFDQTSND